MLRLFDFQLMHNNSLRPFHRWGLCLANYSDPTRFCSRDASNPLQLRGFAGLSVQSDPMRNPETPRREF
jgi:hypothetical protein